MQKATVLAFVEAIGMPCGFPVDPNYSCGAMDLVRRIQHPATLVFGVALIVRVIYCLASIFILDKPPPGGPSHDGYIEIAQALVNGEGYRLGGEPVFFRPPLYVLFLVPWVMLPGTQFWILGAQCLLGAFACALTTRIALRLADRHWAILAGLTMAICPWHVHFTTNAMTPVPASALVMVLLWLWTMDGSASAAIYRQAKVLNPRGTATAFGSGLVYVLLALCHPSTVLIGPIWITHRLWRGMRTGTTVHALAASAMFVTAAVAGDWLWLKRNHHLSGKIIPLSNSAGFQFFVSDDMVFQSGGWFSHPVCGIKPGMENALLMLEQQGLPSNLGQASFKGVGLAESSIFDKWAKKDLRQHPEKLIRRLVQNGWWFWFGDSPAMTPFHLAFKVPLLLMGIFGLIKGLSYGRSVLPAAWMVMSVWAVHAFFMGYIPLAAYCIPVLGPVCVLAAVGMTRRLFPNTDGQPPP